MQWTFLSTFFFSLIVNVIYQDIDFHEKIKSLEHIIENSRLKRLFFVNNNNYNKNNKHAKLWHL